jgi:hypothetical protein
LLRSLILNLWWHCFLKSWNFASDVFWILWFINNFAFSFLLATNYELAAKAWRVYDILCFKIWDVFHDWLGWVIVGLDNMVDGVDSHPTSWSRCLVVIHTIGQRVKSNIRDSPEIVGDMLFCKGMAGGRSLYNMRSSGSGASKRSSTKKSLLKENFSYPDCYTT